MNMETNQMDVKIVGINSISDIISAAAARMSTQEGNAFEILEASKERQDKNFKLVKNVVNSGHKTILEHITMTIAFCNVSVHAEQYFLEHRLASFTVKSRRYVNYSKQGYFIPPDIDGMDRAIYIQYMDSMFNIYNELIEKGFSLEDARFFLPYSFCSNFYCTMNARELLHIIDDIRRGKGAHDSELEIISNKIVDSLREQCPILNPEIEKILSQEKPVSHESIEYIKPDTYYQRDVDLEQVTVKLLNSVSTPEIIEAAECFYDPFKCSRQYTSDNQIDILPRALEQLNYTFAIRNISLSCLTHLTRHRMQSLVVPPIKNIKYNGFIIPPTLSPTARKLYQDRIVEAHRMMMDAFTKVQKRTMIKYRHYFALSGNVISVMTTMNAREICNFMQLRSCMRSQWEIGHVATEMLKLLRKDAPQLFDKFGPSCFVKGYCPEGKMSCGQISDVKKLFEGDLSECK